MILEAPFDKKSAKKNIHLGVSIITQSSKTTHACNRRNKSTAAFVYARDIDNKSELCNESREKLFLFILRADNNLFILFKCSRGKKGGEY